VTTSFFTVLLADQPGPSAHAAADRPNMIEDSNSLRPNRRSSVRTVNENMFASQNHVKSADQ
jgi:hypothetical protein